MTLSTDRIIQETRSLERNLYELFTKHHGYSDSPETVEKWREWQNTNTRLISVEGSIGAGKSYLIERFFKSARGPIALHVEEFQDELVNFIRVKEPVEKWVESGMLEKFYSDNKKYALEFQLYAMFTRLEELFNTLVSEVDFHTVNVIITERCLVSDSIFAKLQHTSQNMSDKEYFDEYVPTLNRLFSMYPGFLIPYKYLLVDTSIRKCLERIARRNRGGGENLISEEYLRSLIDAHYDMFIVGRRTAIKVDNIHTSTLLIDNEHDC